MIWLCGIVDIVVFKLELNDYFAWWEPGRGVIFGALVEIFTRRWDHFWERGFVR
jgi:hypothetical protein